MTRNHLLELNSISVGQSVGMFECSHIDNDILLVDDIQTVPMPNEPRRMECLLMAMCMRGKLRYTVDTIEQVVHKGDIIIIGKDQVTDNYKMSNDCSGVGMMVSYDFLHESIKEIHELSSLFLFARSHPVFHLSDREQRTLLSYYATMKQKIEDTGHHFRRETVQALFKTMIYDMSNTIYNVQNMPTQKKTRAEEIFKGFIELVEQHFREERRVGWYGQQMCITPKYLSETVKRVSNRSPNEWIDHYVTLEIRVLLKNTTMSIKEIAQTLNFRNQSFLGKYFKEHVGMSPSQYRQQ